MSELDLVSLGWTEFFSAQVLPEEAGACQPARIVAAHKTLYGLATEAGVVSGTLAGRARLSVEAAQDAPVVGDWVLVKSPLGDRAIIVRQLERRTAISRRRPLDRSSHRVSTARQVLAANLDIVFVVTSFDQESSPARIERALAMVWGSGAVPVLLFTKADLCDDVEARIAALGDITCGVDVHVTSAVTGTGLTPLLSNLAPGITACLIGSSGAGKTTLLNRLCGTDRKTLTVREDDGRGRHATTERALFFLPEGGMLIDTPGLREIGLLEEHEIAAVFTDISTLASACQFADCTHRVEPGCAVLAAVAAGELDPERYASYLKLQREQEYLVNRDSVAGQQAQKRRDKELGRRIREYFKRNPE